MDRPTTMWLDQASGALRTAAAGAALVTAAKYQGGPELTARCDQVVAMLRDSDIWLTDNPCPDEPFGRGLHFYFANISDLIARRELNVEGSMDLATLTMVVELSADFLAWLNEQLDEPAP